MPTYEYRCENDHVFEVIQRMSDDPVRVCEQCGAPVERVFHPVAVHFKGSGFYTTDYGSSKAAAGDSGGDSSKSEKSSEKSDSKPEKSDSKSGDKGGTKSKSESKAS